MQIIRMNERTKRQREKNRTYLLGNEKRNYTKVEGRDTYGKVRESPAQSVLHALAQLFLLVTNEKSKVIFENRHIDSLDFFVKKQKMS